MVKSRWIRESVATMVVCLAASAVMADGQDVSRMADPVPDPGADVGPMILAPGDADDDGILDDGDGSGTAGDAPCTGGDTTGCDDNCISYANPLQYDLDSDGIGDACDDHTDYTGAVTILTARTFIKLTVDGDLTIAGTGSISHPAGDVRGLEIVVTGILDVAAGGLIDVRGKGLPGSDSIPRNYGPSSTWPNTCTTGGWGFDPSDTTADLEAVICLSNNSGEGTPAGASHAGRGGSNGNNPSDYRFRDSNLGYGSFEDPIHLGAGGGAPYAGGPGGDGGGRVHIVASTLNLDGAIRADAETISNHGGGGGGSIKLDVGTLTATNTMTPGLVHANGAQTSNYSGAGGGGRVVAYYATNDLPTTIFQAHGGIGTIEANWGGAGTIYLRNCRPSLDGSAGGCDQPSAPEGDLILDNAGIAVTKPARLSTGSALPTFGNLDVLNGASLELTSAEVGTVIVNDVLTLDNYSTLAARSGTTLKVPSGQLAVTLGSHLIIDGSATLDSSGALDLTISDNAVVDLLTGSTIVPSIATVTVSSGGTLNLNSGVSIDPNFTTVTLLSGGTFNLDLLVTIGTLAIDGGILNSSESLGWGAGTLTSGELNMASGTTLTLPSFDATNVQAGTVRIADGATLDVLSDAVTIGSGVTLVKDGSLGTGDAIGTLIVETGGTITHTAGLLGGLRLEVVGLLDLGGSIDVTGKGLPGGGSGPQYFGPLPWPNTCTTGGWGFDPSDTTADDPENVICLNNTAGEGAPAGASHAGQGGSNENQTSDYRFRDSNPEYGAFEDPIHLGAGGGGPYSGTGGDGGGRVHIIASTLNLDGTIRADAETINHQGGGAGGSIKLDVGTLTASDTVTPGSVHANGADTTSYYGSGAGGGGRVVLHYATNLIPTTIFQARGGNGTVQKNRAGAGTIFLRQCRPSLDGGAGGCDQPGAPAGDLILGNNGIAADDPTRLLTGTALPIFGNLDILDGAYLELTTAEVGTVIVNDVLTLDNNSTLAARSGTTLKVPSGQLAVTLGAHLIIDGGATLDSDDALDLTISDNAVVDLLTGSTIVPSIATVNVSSDGTLNLNSGVSINPNFTTVMLLSGGTFNLDLLVTIGTLSIDGGILNSSESLGWGADDTLISGELNMVAGTLTLPSFDPTNVQTGTVRIAEGAELDVLSDVVTIGPGVTLVKDGSFGPGDAIGTLTVETGGTITHTAGLVGGLRLEVDGLLDLGGSIDATGKGLPGGDQASALFYDYGPSPPVQCPTGGWGFAPSVPTANAADVICLNNNSFYGHPAGASHGGRGGSNEFPSTDYRFRDSNLPYGTFEDAIHLGAGGGAPYSGGPGRDGGGRIHIIASTLTLDGAISADAETVGGQGGGAGGSIKLDVGTLTASELVTPGSVHANGSPASNYNGAGGGGRVVAHYATNNLPTTIFQARGGSGTIEANRGGAGTIFLRQCRPSLDGGAGGCDQPGAPAGDLILENGGVVAPKPTGLQPPSTGALQSISLYNAAALEASSSDVGVLAVTGELLVDGTGSRLTTPFRDLGGLDLNVGTLTLTGGGSIDVSGKGLAGGGDPTSSFGIVDHGETYVNPARDYTIAPGSTLGSGGSYGGLGGGLNSAPTYGRDPAPYNAGGGGGRTSSSSGTGGAGGGRLIVDAETCTIDSSSAIRADGATGVAGSGSQGGGAGGGVRMVCLTLNGGGAITARGGNGSGIDGNGGGGGRIAVLVNNDNWTSSGGTVDLAGGFGVGAGVAGETTPDYIFTDAVPPTVTAMNVMIGASNPGLYDRLEIHFSENLDGAPAAIDPAHVLLSGTLSGAHVPDSITFDTGNQVMTVTYPYNLPDDTYGLMLVSGRPGSGLSDSSGRALDGDYDSMAGLPSGDGSPRGDFIVGFGIDAPPWVRSVVPARGSTEVALATNVSLRFTEAIATGTVSATSVIVTDLTAGTTVPGTYSFSPVGDRVTLDPTTPLALGHLHRVEVTTDVTDTTGQPALLFSSVFRTSSTPPGERTLPSVSDALTALGVSSGSGAAVARGGDLNGDGILDLLIGAPAYATSGIVETGAVGIYLGSTDAAERAAPDIIFEGVSAHDRSGASIAGDFDFNDDGYSDILIGSTQINRTIDDDPVAGCDAGAACGPGKVYVIFFDPTDATTYPNLGTPSVADVIDLARVANGLADEIPGVVLNGIALGDTAGFAVDGGASLNADAIDDIAIGVPGVDGAGLTDSGAVYVVFGGTSVTGVHTLSEVGPPPPGVLGKVYRGEMDGGHLGASVAWLGDVFSAAARAVSSGGELVMGAPFEDGQDDQSNPVPEGGVVYIEQGGDLDTDEVFVCSIGTTLPGIQVKGTQPFEHLGSSVDDGGDSRLNGVDDVLIGSPGYDVDLLADAGRVVQTSSQLTTGVYLADEIGTTQDGVIWTGADAGDGLGTAVAGVGDVTGDGVDDIVLGAPYADPVIQSVTYSDAGAVYLIEGQAPASGIEGVISASEVGVTVPGVVLVGTQVDELAGSALAGVGDLDGNGDGDYVVGAPLHDEGGNLDSGIVYVVLESEPSTAPVSGECDASGCLAIDMANGAMLNVDSGALSGPVTIGITSPGVGTLPGAPPAGTILVGAVALTPDGLLLNHSVDVYLPVLQSMSWQVADLETFDLLCWSGSAWVDSGTDAIVGDSPVLPGEKAAWSQVAALSTCAIFATDGDGDGVRDLLDNCASVSNASQADVDGNGIGDACGSSPRFRVSSDPTDMADFVTIQAAVDAVSSPGVRIDVMPGMGAYAGTVIVDRDLALSLVGDTNGGPVTLEGTGGPAIDVVSTSGGMPIRVSNLILGGSAGIRAAVSTLIRDVTIDTVTGAALKLTGGEHLVERVTIDGALDGVLLSAGATVDLRDTSITAATGTALQVDGTATVETALVATCGQGITVGASGAATIAGSTVAAQSGAGIDGSSGGSVTLTRSIVHGNGGGDLVGVACSQVFASLIGGVDCSASNGNLFADPLLDGSHRPGAGSPAIDAGVDPVLYDGLPCRDLTGGPRLRDGNGDGLADGDLGAYEYVPPAAPPGEVADLAWADGATLSWQVNLDAVEYHVYRGELGSPAYSDFGTCRDDLDPVRTDESLIDVVDPPPGVGWYYQITAESNGGIEGSAGYGTCAERSRFVPCP